MLIRNGIVKETSRIKRIELQLQNYKLVFQITFLSAVFWCCLPAPFTDWWSDSGLAWSVRDNDLVIMWCIPPVNRFSSQHQNIVPAVIHQNPTLAWRGSALNFRTWATVSKWENNLSEADDGCGQALGVNIPMFCTISCYQTTSQKNSSHFSSPDHLFWECLLDNAVPLY